MDKQDIFNLLKIRVGDIGGFQRRAAGELKYDGFLLGKLLGVDRDHRFDFFIVNTLFTEGA